MSSLSCCFVALLLAVLVQSPDLLTAAATDQIPLTVRMSSDIRDVGICRG